MITNTKNKTTAAGLLARLTKSSAKLPASWTKARGMLQNQKQIRALEKHVKKVRAEWR
ncbi:MAG: hypothetical protein UY50_C0027G0015 [Parcubacteria group bacterium GW2011_GWA2_49_9]|nr:MAG: hypothetical protein UY50_C0027G0015 [Parcubacteria group bacterium GW2011_GWA2_49_9]